MHKSYTCYMYGMYTVVVNKFTNLISLPISLDVCLAVTKVCLLDLSCLFVCSFKSLSARQTGCTEHELRLVGGPYDTGNSCSGVVEIVSSCCDPVCLASFKSPMRSSASFVTASTSMHNENCTITTHA